MIRMSRGLLRAGAHVAYGRAGAPRLLVLMYHRVLTQPDPLQPEQPDAALADTHFKVLRDVFQVQPLDEAIEALQAGRLAPRTACITFDDGYRDNHDVALPLLARHGLTATFFIASGFLNGGCMFNDVVVENVRRLPTGPLDLSHWGIEAMNISDVASRRHAATMITRKIKYFEFDQRRAFGEELTRLAGAALPQDVMMSTDQLAHMARAGMSIGGHTVNHPILAKVDDTVAQQEIIENRNALRDMTGVTPRTFAYPNGKPVRDYTPRHAEMVKAAGYRGAVSTAFGVGDQSSDRYQLPRIVPSKTTYPKAFLQMIRASAHLA